MTLGYSTVDLICQSFTCFLLYFLDLMDVLLTRSRKSNFHLLSRYSRMQSCIRHYFKSLPRVRARTSLDPTTSWRVEMKSSPRWRNLVEQICRIRKNKAYSVNKSYAFFFFTLITRLGKHFVFSQKRNKKSVFNFLLQMLYVAVFMMN